MNIAGKNFINFLSRGAVWHILANTFTDCLLTSRSDTVNAEFGNVDSNIDLNWSCGRVTY